MEASQAVAGPDLEVDGVQGWNRFKAVHLHVGVCVDGKVGEESEVGPHVEEPIGADQPPS